MPPTPSTRSTWYLPPSTSPSRTGAREGCGKLTQESEHVSSARKSASRSVIGLFEQLQVADESRACVLRIVDSPVKIRRRVRDTAAHERPRAHHLLGPGLELEMHEEL